MSMIFIDT